jgi:serine/threonine protein kinase
LTYFAPDKEKSKKVSRPFDMWALGCVYLELMVWLFGFFDSKEHGFSTDRFDCTAVDEKNKDSAFWTTTETGEHVEYELKSSVKGALRSLRDKECVELRAFVEVVDVIERLLDLDSKTRMTADELTKQLKRTIKQAQSDLEKDPMFYLDRFMFNMGETTEERFIRRLPSMTVIGSRRSESFSSQWKEEERIEHRRLPTNGLPSQALLHAGAELDPSTAVPNGISSQDDRATSERREDWEQDFEAIHESAAPLHGTQSIQRP